MPPPPLLRSLPQPRSYANAAAEPGPSTAQPAQLRASPSSDIPQPKTQRYPPLVVESLPNWPHDLGEIKKILCRAAYARPFGHDIRFPEDGHEYRVIQRYLSELEKTEDVAWHSYTLSSD